VTDGQTDGRTDRIAISVSRVKFNIAETLRFFSERQRSCWVCRQVAREFTRLKSECRDDEVTEWIGSVCSTRSVAPPSASCSHRSVTYRTSTPCNGFGKRVDEQIGGFVSLFHAIRLLRI